jgi:hypothetical protein
MQERFRLNGSPKRLCKPSSDFAFLAQYLNTFVQTTFRVLSIMTQVQENGQMDMLQFQVQLMEI